jgi:hypothetical protein
MQSSVFSLLGGLGVVPSKAAVGSGAAIASLSGLLLRPSSSHAAASPSAEMTIATANAAW